MNRIDRDIQQAVFIPKGTWMVGGAVSYSEHDEGNLNFLVLKNVEGIRFCYLTDVDVVRHELVKRIIKAYNDYEKKSGDRRK